MIIHVGKNDGMLSDHDFKKNSFQDKKINGSFFYGSVPGCSEVESRASNLCWLRVSLPGACEATRNILTAYGRKYVICSLVRL
jgi:hypothetical protein